MNFEKRAEALRQKIIEDRRYLHCHAEFGMKLPETVSYVTKRLKEIGLQPVSCGGGIICDIGEGEKTVLLRADMDALKVIEDNDLSFRSQTEISHMCGHDLHTAMLLGTAKLLKEYEPKLKGRVRLMFQPAEEVMAGAKSMLDAGVLENPSMEAAFSLHVFTTLENGVLSYKVGNAFSSIDIFQIRIEGKGGHGSALEYTVDPIKAAMLIYQGIEGVVARETSMFHSATCSIGHFEAGTMYNVIPESALLEGTLRCFDDDDRQRILERIQHILDGVSQATGTTCTLKTMSTPSLKNDPALCGSIAPYLSEIQGLQVMETTEPASGSEDFAFISEKVPTMYMLLGVGNRNAAPNHNAKAIFAEDKMYLGSAAMALAAVKYLENC